MLDRMQVMEVTPKGRAASSPAQLGSPTLYVLVILLVALTTFAWKLRSTGVFACQAGNYSPDSYLADCQAEGYGDYDHGAFWFNLEPEATKAVSEADALFLGSSRMQFGFSTGPTARWFSSVGARYFLLGFSHTENQIFFAPLLEKIRPRSKVVVINVDRFFDDRVSPPVGDITSGGDARTRYTQKGLWQSVHRFICGSVAFLCGKAMGIFRSRPTGAWALSGRVPAQNAAVREALPSNQHLWPHYAALAKDFISKLPVDPGCIILTIVPSEETRLREASSIAAAMNIPLVAPEVPALKTFDGSHLDRVSADQWSSAFFEAAGPAIKRCLSRSDGKAEVTGAAGQKFQ